MLFQISEGKRDFAVCLRLSAAVCTKDIFSVHREKKFGEKENVCGVAQRISLMRSFHFVIVFFSQVPMKYIIGLFSN